MKRFFKILGIIIIVLIVAVTAFYFTNNEPLPMGEKGEKAEKLAKKMLAAINNEAYENTEVLEWSFRDTNFYKWYKQQNLVEVSWNGNKVALDTRSSENSKVINNPDNKPESELIKKATTYFNNDSFWLVAPHKILDAGTERRIVNYNGKDALLVSYTSGGSTPGDSYLWILDDNGFPTSYKMWVGIIPIGGIEATWNNWKQTNSGVQLPTKHSISLFGLEIDMGDVKTSNPTSDGLANKILKAIKHDAYNKTNFLEWSFGGRRSYKWNKKDHIVEVLWDSTKVILHPDNLDKSTLFYNDKPVVKNEEVIKKAESYFNNDSFWLVAPHKLFETGIIRTVKKVDGKDALLVKYTQGGTTPGDSYLWILDENYIPKSYKMYVPSMKMDGVSATWKDWITTESGTLLPTNHTFGENGVLSMGDVKGYN